MRVDVRPIQRLRGPKPVDVTSALDPVVRALCADDTDLSRVRVVCDWIQYRNNFRDIVDFRPIVAADAEPAAERSHEDGLEIAVDLRRCADIDTESHTKQILCAHHRPNTVSRVYLEPWRAGKDSCIWDFNTLYWQALSLWEETTGQKYEQALPGGESDARNRAAVRELISDLFTIWDDLRHRNALPEELYIIELGVGNGNQAKTWLDEFVRLDHEYGRDYYRRLHYLMGDYSPHVLDQARRTVADHGEHVSSLVLDATCPTTALGFLRYKAFLVYISNVYDNLPTDEIAYLSGRPYLTEVRAYLPDVSAKELAEQTSSAPGEIPNLVGRLIRLGPELLSESLPHHFPSAESAVQFWRHVWLTLRLEERYVPLTGLDHYQVAPKVTGEVLRPLLEADGDIRMHVSNGAVASFVETLPLLHPYGRLLCHDLFVTDVHQYQTGFFGPGKYDGSVVNWVNGPLLDRVGIRRGFEVGLAPFAHRVGTNITTLTAQVRE